MAIGEAGSRSVLLFNLGVLLDDMGRKPERARPTRRRLKKRDPVLARLHYKPGAVVRRASQTKRSDPAYVPVSQTDRRQTGVRKESKQRSGATS